MCCKVHAFFTSIKKYAISKVCVSVCWEVNSNSILMGKPLLLISKVNRVGFKWYTFPLTVWIFCTIYSVQISASLIIGQINLTFSHSSLLEKREYKCFFVFFFLQWKNNKFVMSWKTFPCQKTFENLIISNILYPQCARLHLLGLLILH